MTQKVGYRDNALFFESRDLRARDAEMLDYWVGRLHVFVELYAWRRVIHSREKEDLRVIPVWVR